MSESEDETLKEMERKVYSRKKAAEIVKNSRGTVSLGMASEGMNSGRRLGNTVSDRDGVVGKGGFMRQESRVRINLSMKSRNEKRELKRKLEVEREVVRSLMRRIEVNEGQKNNDRGLNDVRGDNNTVASGVGPPRMSKPLNQLSVSVSEANKSGGDKVVEKEKRTPKANKMYRNSEFLLAKDKFPPPESNKSAKSSKKKGGKGGSELGKFPIQVLKSCSALLERLMKHKHGWVFNTPVDTVALGLHDYFEIIKKPMDLGTVKNRLNQNWYKSPREFAEDVRLTFQNAMTYNPKGQDVYLMAEQLAKIFDEKWAPIEADYARELKHSVNLDVGSPTPPSRKAPPKQKSRPDAKAFARSESRNDNVDAKKKPINSAQSGRAPNLKKPKARDPNKREMTYDEKQKLSLDLQSLPSEKLEMVVQIIKKRNFALTQQDDEIEVDIDTVDTETLWELDRFITNFKKGLSKNKRKAEIISQLIADPEETPQEKIPTSVVAETSKGSGTDEERVVSPPVRVEKPGKNDNQGAIHSSSGSDSGSSSSDSEGGSSDGDGSDGEHSSKD